MPGRAPAPASGPCETHALAAPAGARLGDRRSRSHAAARRVSARDRSIAVYSPSSSTSCPLPDHRGDAEHAPPGRVPGASSAGSTPGSARGRRGPYNLPIRCGHSLVVIYAAAASTPRARGSPRRHLHDSHLSQAPACGTSTSARATRSSRRAVRRRLPQPLRARAGCSFTVHPSATSSSMSPDSSGVTAARPRGVR